MVSRHIDPSNLPDQYVDTHVHTKFCGHAIGDMEEYVLAALAKGLGKITFLEHMEEGIISPVTTWLSETDFDVFFSEGERLRGKYGDRINIGMGVECGFNPDAIDGLRARLARRSWDQIGISCHYLKVPEFDRHINLFSRKADNIHLAQQIGWETLMDLYLKTLSEAVRQLPGTLLCHLDGALRHLPAMPLTSSQYAAIEELLLAAGDKGMAIEVNTSGITMRGEPFPSRRILAMIRHQGTPLVLGSDAHKPEDVGRYFAEAATFLP
ncbi:MAG: histidinol-phosphatase [Desulforhopalus sp.]|nr:histidinol-phosphatase [Desulforhopalus sp.]